MTERAKIFLSDLHVGGGGVSDDFSEEKENTFVQLLTELTEQYESGSELILLGDIFDLIEQDIEDSSIAVETAMAAHQDTVNALNEWLLNKNKLFYITGNHDHAFRFPNVYTKLAERILKPDDQARKVPWGNFVVDDWYASKSFKIYAEHGNRFDEDNNHAGEDICFGDIIVKKVLRPLESGDQSQKYLTKQPWTPPHGVEGDNPFMFIDNVRPRGNIILLIEKLIDDGYLKPETKDELKNKILNAYKENPHICKINSFIIKRLRWLIGDGLIQKKLDDHYLPYRKNAREMMDASSKNNILKLRDLSFKPQFIIMGHTHFFDQCSIQKNCRYINLSSWLDTIYLDDQGNIGQPMKNCPFLVFTKDDQEIKYTMFDSDLSKPFDWQKLLANRKSYNIPTSDSPEDEDVFF